MNHSIHSGAQNNRSKAANVEERVEMNAHLWLFILAHIPLALVLDLSSLLSAIFATIVLLFAFSVAFRADTDEQVAYVVTYLLGAEVLWRMTEAWHYYIPWEFAKYAIVGTILIRLLRKNSTKLDAWLVLFGVLLIPAAVTTLFYFPTFVAARQALSFNLSGLFTFLICAWFFSNISFDRNSFANLVVFLVGPVISIGVLSLKGILTANIQWITESNFAASGGFGPNQVSAALGLGVLFIWLLVSADILKWKTARYSLLSIGVWLLAQGILTFSRGGVLTAGVAIGVVSLHLLFERRRNKQIIGLFSIAATVLVAVVIPRLERITDYTLAARYAETSVEATGRLNIAQEDIAIFRENPLLGVGVGLSAEYLGIAAHTEFSRILAEHGLLGAIAILILLFFAARRYLSPANSLLERAVVAGLMAWAVVDMLHSAMRIAAPGVLLAMAFVDYQLDD